LFYDVHKENMFTTNLEDGREAPSKARKKGAKRLEFLVGYIRNPGLQGYIRNPGVQGFKGTEDVISSEP